MTPERWQLLDQLLAAALDLDPGERASFVDGTTGGDHDLRVQLNSLLAAADRSDSFLEAPPAEAIKTLFARGVTLEIGQMIGHYQIVGPIGAGGMGEVYLARDLRLGRRVALKLLMRDFTRVSERVRRFEQEARAASALNHPNILTIHDIGQSGGLHFIAAEFVDGLTLRQKLADGPLPLAEAIVSARQVAAALAASHAAGIVHRDIKPENVMVRQDGLVKVLDFGLAKLLSGEEVQSIPTGGLPALGGHSLGALMGTPPYMSPEQARGGELDARTDLFSFGAMLYEMVAGKPPFTGESGPAILDAICQQEPPPLSSLDLPLALEQIIFRCLEKDPAERYGAAQEIADALERVVEGLAQERRSEPAKPSIAILPFVNLSGDPENEYFGDGLAEELLNALARIERLHVAARTSAFSFKGKNTDVREIGRRLNVTTVLEGSVRRAGDRLRITVQLVNAADGYDIWSERFDRRIEDIFSIQDEIVLALVEALKVKLLGEEKARLLKRYTDNTEAYRFYLKGRTYCHRATREAFDKAIEFFEQAVGIDPDYAPAWGGIVYTYLSLAFYGYPREDLTSKCAMAMARAVQLDPDQHDVALALSSFKCYYQWDFAGAEQEYKRAIQLAPNLAGGHLAYAGYMVAMGRFDEAIAQARRSEDLDPLSLYSILVLGWVYWYTRRYEQALAQTRKLIEMDSAFFGTYWLRGMTRLRLGQHSEAIADLEQSLALGGGLQPLAHLGVCYGKAGKRAEAEQVIAQLLERRSRETVQAYFLALVYGSLERTDETLVWLEKAVEERNDVLLNIRTTKVFDFLCSNPRFAALIERIGFPT